MGEILLAEDISLERQVAVKLLPAAANPIGWRASGWPRRSPRKTIARTVGVERNTVKRYVQVSIEPGIQVRPVARRLTGDARREALKTRASSLRR
jgi:hypothetical protein